MVDESVFALNSCVSDLANLLAFEMLPFLPVEGLIKSRDVFGCQEVDEGIADIAPILWISGEITLKSIGR